MTTDVGCCRELLGGMQGDSLGIAGYCVPPMHANSLCVAMERMCMRKEERFLMGKIGQNRVEKYYQHEEMIKKYQGAYQEVFKRWLE